MREASQQTLLVAVGADDRVLGESNIFGLLLYADIVRFGNLYCIWSV